MGTPAPNLDAQPCHLPKPILVTTQSHLLISWSHTAKGMGAMSSVHFPSIHSDFLEGAGSSVAQAIWLQNGLQGPIAPSTWHGLKRLQGT